MAQTAPSPRGGGRRFFVVVCPRLFSVWWGVPEKIFLGSLILFCETLVSGWPWVVMILVVVKADNLRRGGKERGGGRKQD